MMNPVIALSTSYLQHNFPDDGYAMLEEAARLGYKYVELGHSTPMTAVEGIMRAIGDGVAEVASVHSFCPTPPFAKGAVPNLFSPSTGSKLESRQWVRHMRNTMQFSTEVGAKAIVCHCGELSHFFMRPDAKLARMLKNSGGTAPNDDDDYLKTKELFAARAVEISERKDYPRLAKNLAEIHADAIRMNLCMCLENREGISELPLDWNFGKLFSDSLSALHNVWAWHDVGHSKRKELAHLYKQEKFAEDVAPRLRGWHLHDCSESGKDHIAVGKGCIDFKMLSKFFDVEKHIFTLELNKAVERADAADSLKRVQDLMS